MLRDRGPRIVIVFAVVLAGVSWAWSQNLPRRSVFAVEVSDRGGYPPSYINIYPSGGEWTSTLRRSQPGQTLGPSTPSALQLKYKVEGDAVVVAASLLFPPFEPGSTPPREGVPMKQVGTYTLRLNDSVALKGMEGYGLAPVTIRLVDPQPPPRARPFVFSQAPSVQIAIGDEEWNVYKLVLRNLSSRAVTGVYVDRRKEGQAQGQYAFRQPSLIAPGGTYEISFGRISWKRTAANGGVWVEVVETPPPDIVLEAALFEDGTYEGTPAIVACQIAMEKVRTVQHARVVEVVGKIITDETLDDAAKSARIREEAPNISENIDPAITDEIRSKFPNLSPDEWTSIETRIKIEVMEEKRAVVRSLTEYEANRPALKGSRPPTLADWYGLWMRHMGLGIRRPAPAGGPSAVSRQEKQVPRCARHDTPLGA